MGTVSFDDAGIEYTSRDAAARRIEWADLRAVEVLTTDAGPVAEDVYWVMHGSGTSLPIPQTADGTDSLLSRLQLLPGFDNRAFIEAMSSFGNQRFTCWERS